MTRFALIAALAALPFAVVAAPVPEPVPKPFGTDGIVSRAELEALAFDSRAVPDKERTRDRVRRVVEIQKRRAEDDGAPPKVRPANRFDVGVHMPATRFKVGEPVVAYFVVRNNRAEELDLDGRLDFADGTPVVCNDCDLRVLDARNGKPPIGEGMLQLYKCGRREMLLVPSDGFYCVKGDLGPLPAGEYTVDWRCGEFRSAPVRFRVFDRDGHAPPAIRAVRSNYLFFHLDDDDERDHDDLEVPEGGPMRRFVALEEFPAEEMAAALACGGEDGFAFVPDARAIPSRDKTSS